jgi:parallel beta-helix repeat protein
MVDGDNYTGYFIKIDNSDHILIKNFTLVNHFNYAVYITNSSNIEIEANNFSYNKVDSTGFIDVWAGYTDALGGGVICYNCDSVHIHGNMMKYQNDGVALYNSKKALIYFNDFSWNTSYGIRMFWADSSYIHHNNAAHINRPYTDPSDCSAILMIVSNENRVEYNDFRYSGDGVFLGQYQHSTTPNNNFFGYNDCSGSPHNAIEATFADGNIYKQNICNMSQYGLWLGYSFNSVVDSNQVLYNHHSGIAVDRGFNNIITHNWFIGNPLAIELWEGSPITGYQNQTSRDYTIETNYFEGNTVCINAAATENTRIHDNRFIKNYDGIILASNCTGDTISNNLFDQSLRYDICNNSSYDIYAVNDTFAINDTNYINAKIYDKLDNPLKGTVEWKPYTGVKNPVYITVPPVELSEPPSLWYPYPEICQWLGLTQELSLTWDSTEKTMGAASLHLSTGTGWYNSCSFRDTGNVIARWDLTDYGYLSFWIKSVNNNLGAFQYFHVRVGNIEGGYFRYNSTGTILNQSLGVWKNYLVPLYGGNGWTRTQVGSISFDDVNYVEIYTDSYGVGYDLWLDGVQFLLATEVKENRDDSFQVSVYPNPASAQSYLEIHQQGAHTVSVTLNDLQGRMIRVFDFPGLSMGNTTLLLDLTGIRQGVYMATIQSGNNRKIQKLNIIN